MARLGGMIRASCNEGSDASSLLTHPPAAACAHEPVVTRQGTCNPEVLARSPKILLGTPRHAEQTPALQARCGQLLGQLISRWCRLRGADWGRRHSTGVGIATIPH